MQTYWCDNEGKLVIVRGINRKGLIAACVFSHVKKEKKPKSPKEIAKIFELEITDVTNGCRTFMEMMVQIII